MADLSAATVEDVAAFFKMYYAPNNAMIAIVGDVDAKATLEKVKKYFGAIPRQPAPPAGGHDRAAAGRGAARDLDDQLARLPRLDMAYNVPAGSSPDYDALDVLSTILSGGRSARFYESIVRQKQLATSAFAGVGGVARSRSLLSQRDADAEQVASPTSRRRSTPSSRRSRTGRSPTGSSRKRASPHAAAYVASLGQLTRTRDLRCRRTPMFYDDPDLLSKRQARIAKVTAADVQRVAKQYLVKTNRTVVVTSQDVRPRRELTMIDLTSRDLAHRALGIALIVRGTARGAAAAQRPSSRRPPRRWCSRAKRRSRTTF